MNLDVFHHIKNVKVEEKAQLEKFSTMKLEGLSPILLIKERDALKEVLKNLHDLKLGYRLLGLGANQVLKPNSSLVYLKLDFSLNEEALKKPSLTYSLPASFPLSKLVSLAQRFGLKGFEVATGIPATLGGAVFMNAGTRLGEVGDFVKEVTLMSQDGSLRVHKVDKDSFSYRKNHFTREGEVIVEVLVKAEELDHEETRKVIREYLNYRKKTQPLSEATCGCLFKNPSSDLRAGHMIDLLGLKGFSHGSLSISHLHANFALHHGGGDFSDFSHFCRILKEELHLYTGCEFEFEVDF